MADYYTSFSVLLPVGAGNIEAALALYAQLGDELEADGQAVGFLAGDAFVVDQDDELACQSLGFDRELSNEPWRTALAAHTEPPSWRNADAARTAGADGIIDRSRMIPGGWHLNLFRWNELGGPSIEVCGEPIEIKLSESGLKWSL